MRTLRIGTRGSALARWQAEHVRDLLGARGFRSEVCVISTSGDRGHSAPGEEPGKALFTKEIEDALLDGELDLAVHSLKDVAIVMPDGLTLAAVPQRADPRDAVVSRQGCDLRGLAAGARVGTTSIRRRSALLALRQDLEVVPVRGNVPTRVQQVTTGEVDAVILAMAGLVRLGMADGAMVIPAEEMVPAPGQGALAIQIRSDDAALMNNVAFIDDAGAHIAVRAERAALEGLESGCAVPIGAHCARAADSFTLMVAVYAVDGSRVLRSTVDVDPGAPERAGRAAADELERQGAGRLIEAAMDTTGGE